MAMDAMPVATNRQPENVSVPTPSLSAKKPPRPKRKGKNFAQIHSKPLPLETHPLPAFHPSNPISLLRLAYTYLSHLLLAPSSHPIRPYSGYFSTETRSVHVTDPEHARALWEMGFFGKGTLSRSEPSWVERERARLMKDRGGGRKAAEDATKVRREERRMFKLERARVEAERIGRQRLVEEGKLDANDVLDDDEKDSSIEAAETVIEPTQSDALATDHRSPNEALNGIIVDEKTIVNDRTLDESLLQNHDSRTQLLEPKTDATPNTATETAPPSQDDTDLCIQDQEHLQLTLEEAFFLSYGLGVLNIYPSSPPETYFPWSIPEPYTNIELFEFFSQYSHFPPSPTPAVEPDDPFLLNYVAYHHFRSLGWVVRPGVKFGIDYLLYNRGPVFSHAEFAVLILPAYTERYWNTPGGRSRRRVWEQKDWWWLHCVNRVQSQVKKTLVVCYVDVPSPFDVDFDEPFDVGSILRRYKVREFVVRRWLANRMRD